MRQGTGKAFMASQSSCLVAPVLLSKSAILAECVPLWQAFKICCSNSILKKKRICFHKPMRRLTTILRK